jgi:hypothetical protein
MGLALASYVTPGHPGCRLDHASTQLLLQQQQQHGMQGDCQLHCNLHTLHYNFIASVDASKSYRKVT